MIKIWVKDCSRCMQQHDFKKLLTQNINNINIKINSILYVYLKINY